jgi:glycosyltransferase involved in cell wall biosynthesis
MVKNKISILVPTRNRFNNIVRLIKSIKDTAYDFNNIEILLYVDNDDTNTLHSINENRKDLHGACVYTGKQGTLGSAYNALYKKCTGNIIMSGADDIIFKTKEWDKILLDNFNKLDSKIALFASNDLYTNPDDLSTHPFLTREAINCFGFFIPSKFDCNYADRWYTDIFKRVKRYIVVPIIIEHMHWLNNKAERDSTYLKGSANMRRHSQHVFDQSLNQRIQLAEKLQFSINNTEKITIVLNTRRKENENTGNITTFLTALNKSLYSPNNVEVIFKIDTDDDESLNELEDIINKGTYPFNVKYVNTTRVFYKGLHIGYKQAFDIRSKNSKIIFAMADDFVFDNKRYNWDKEILEQVSHLTRDDIFILTDFISADPDCNPNNPGWSVGLIELCNGFGVTYSTDAWTSFIARYLIDNGTGDRIFCYKQFTKRITCHLDNETNARWYTDRQDMINYHKSAEYRIYLETTCKEIVKYHEHTLMKDKSFLY